MTCTVRLSALREGERFDSISRDMRGMYSMSSMPEIALHTHAHMKSPADARCVYYPGPLSTDLGNNQQTNWIRLWHNSF